MMYFQPGPPFIVSGGFHYLIHIIKQLLYVIKEINNHIFNKNILKTNFNQSFISKTYSNSLTHSSVNIGRESVGQTMDVIFI